MRQRLQRVFIGAGLVLATACSSTMTQQANPLADLEKLTQQESCNSTPDTAQPQWVIGYGSLMQQESRQRTAPEASTAHAANVKGYRRGWFAKGSPVGFSTTFLGAVPDASASMNAVVFSVSTEALAALDRRESGYCRSQVKPGHLQLSGKAEAIPAGQYWIYSNLPDSIALPDNDRPLVQSYVDIFIGGCLELEEQYQLAGFAEECIRTTSGWSEHWVNDRLYPRRPFIHQPRAGQIDRLLDKELPGIFRQIRIE